MLRRSAPQRDTIRSYRDQSEDRGIECAVSFAPPGLYAILIPFTPGWRRGLCSCATGHIASAPTGLSGALGHNCDCS